MFSPGALEKLSFGDQRARRVDGRPVVGDGLDELFDVGVVGGLVSAAMRWVMDGGWFGGSSGVGGMMSVP